MSRRGDFFFSRKKNPEANRDFLLTKYVSVGPLTKREPGINNKTAPEKGKSLDSGRSFCPARRTIEGLTRARGGRRSGDRGGGGGGGGEGRKAEQRVRQTSRDGRAGGLFFPERNREDETRDSGQGQRTRTVDGGQAGREGREQAAQAAQAAQAVDDDGPARAVDGGQDGGQWTVDGSGVLVAVDWTDRTGRAALARGPAHAPPRPAHLPPGPLFIFSFWQHLGGWLGYIRASRSSLISRRAEPTTQRAAHATRW
jgi:hypothetical protein